MQQSLCQVMESLPQAFIEKIKETDSVPTLIKMKKGASDDEILVIDARIQNLNHLVI